jgi:hypothetical protein
VDSSEQLVFEYLSRRGFESVVFEPDGNVPPDFVADGRVAVEVRRLNQHDESEVRPRGLEETAYPLMGHVRQVLKSLGPPLNGESWFVSYTYRRPLAPWKTLERRLRDVLAAFRDGPTRRTCDIVVANGFELDVRQASKTHSTFFLLGAVSDHDSGGFVLAEMDRNIRICVAEKTRKVEPVRSTYPEWWLALVDHIGYGHLDAVEQAELRRVIALEHGWDKILLVHPLDANQAFEL